MGGFEPKAKPWTVDPIPATFQFELLDEDWDQFEPLMTAAIHRTPCLETAQGQDAPQRPRELHARRQLHPRRGARAAPLLRRRRLQLGRHRQLGRRRQADRRVDRRRRARRATSPTSTSAASARTRPTRRRSPSGPARRSACTTRCAGRARSSRRRGRCGRARSTTCSPPGARSSAQERLGAGELLPRRAARRRRRIRTRSAKPAWLADVVREQRATRQAVALYDQTSFGKMLLQGRDALAVAAAPVRERDGRRAGPHGLHADAQRARRLRERRHGDRVSAVDRFLIVTGSAQTPRDLDWIARHTRAGESAALVDVSAMTAVLSLMGPNARDAARPRRRDRHLRRARSRAAALRDHARDRPRLRARSRRAHELRRRPGLRALRADRDGAPRLAGAARGERGPRRRRRRPRRRRLLRARCACASRPAVAPGAPSSARTRRRSRPERCSR